MTRDEVERIAKIAAREAVKDATPEIIKAIMKHHGIDTNDEFSAQKDFIFLRNMRIGAEKIHTRGLMLVFTALVTGVLSAVWYGFKGAIK